MQEALRCLKSPMRSYLEAPRTDLPGPRFPVIDAHSHLRGVQDVGALVGRMDELGIERIVDLDGYADERFEERMRRFVRAYPGRFSLFTLVDVSDLDAPGFPARVRAFLRERREAGASGVKFHKTLGLSVRDRSGRYVLPDDPRLRAVWETAAELRMPVTIHIADPVAFFDPVEPENERYVELSEHPDWSFADPALPRFEELLQAQERLLTGNPATAFIIAHVGSHAENLRHVADMLRSHPNMYTDTAERIAELGRQPYSSRAFLTEFSDRVLYGTDLVPNRTNTAANYRFFQTLDEYFPYNSWEEHHQGGWNIYGVGLPDDALRKIYRANALRLIPR